MLDGGLNDEVAGWFEYWNISKYFQQAVRTCPGGNYCDWRPHSPTWSDEAARRSHHERWRGSCPYYAVGWEETRTEKSIKIYKNKFVLETNLHVTDHPEETLRLVRFDLRVEEDVFAVEIVRDLETAGP